MGYRGMQRQKQREEEQQDWENDPRWNRERFSFVPRRPKNFMEDKKYSRLAACSRTSSMRSDVHGAGPAAPSSGVPPSKPPTSAEASQENVAKSSAAIPPPPKPKIIKPKKNRKPAPTPPTPSANATAEPTQSAEQKADSNV